MKSNKIIIEYLKGLKGRKIRYIPNRGNAGDSMIAYATLQVFRKIGLDFDINEIGVKCRKGEVVVFGGGGQRLHKCRDLPHTIKLYQETNEVLILPSTIQNAAKPLAKFGDNVTIFAREKVSYNHIKRSMAFPMNAYISDDMAFFMEGLEGYSNKHSAGILNAIRLDGEKTGLPIPKNNQDISHIFTKPNNTIKENVINLCTHEMLSYVSKFTEINTNRLHVAIAGALLGKKVNLYSNSYYKCKAVYEYSIINRYPNVTFKYLNSN